MPKVKQWISATAIIPMDITMLLAKSQSNGVNRDSDPSSNFLKNASGRSMRSEIIRDVFTSTGSGLPSFLFFFIFDLCTSQPARKITQRTGSPTMTIKNPRPAQNMFVIIISSPRG
ncbi:MAG: hypothetical protein METHP_00873 [Methanoregula sp. SKADARSKE-2]|nr:MAG: hypothetical protein METHP_00873 [Methanoregula sp. SKADARSKE-2]